MAWIDWYLNIQEQLACLLAGTNEAGTAIPAHERHLGAVGGHTVVKDLTLSLDTSAYADGDVLAATQELASALRVAAGSGILDYLVVVDKDDQAQALDVLILDSNVAIGTENAAVSISDANAAKVLGRVVVAAADFYDLGGVQVATKAKLSIPVAVGSGTSLYVAAVSRGTGTYTASGIVLRLGILQD